MSVYVVLRMPDLIEKSLAGWGNFRPETCFVARPERQAELRNLIVSNGKRRSLIARGLGRSYGDSAVNGGGEVSLQARLDCLIGFDPTTGIVEAEAGISFATLIEIFLPRGFFLPVTPGTKFVTLGGAIAADVHGKNHHNDGTLSRFVPSLRLLLASGETLDCSPEKNADVFWATVGGMGLTGMILSARLQLIRVSSAYAEVEYKKSANLDQALERFESRRGRDRKYSVAWIDCLAGGASLGRCVLMEGDHLSADRLPYNLKDQPFDTKPARAKSVPFHFPNIALNSLSVRLFNDLYYERHHEGIEVVALDPFFYPLDGIHHWNRIYGRRGFVQYQALLPPQTARRGLIELLERISASGNASFLAVLKRTGDQGPGMLSFPTTGYTLALDLANTGEKLNALNRELDEILLKHGGRLYLAKDSLMSAETFAAMYPRLEEFRAVKKRVDPGGRFSSTQARRVGIV